MELALNVLWALVVCGTFAVLLPRSRGGRVAIIGLACVAALLFPVISVSDDLNAAFNAWEVAAVAFLPVAVSQIAVAFRAIGHVEVEAAPALIRLLPADSDPRSPPHPIH